MAAKVFILLALTVAIVSAENECNCDPKAEEDSRAVWDFLKKLSGNELTDADQMELRAVLPGVLSPLLECNCLEKNRRKRKIMPEVEDNEKVNFEEPKARDPVREKKSIHYNSRHCAKGYAQVGFMCIRKEYLDDE